MFTDKPTLPLHLETLLDVVKEFPDAKFSRKKIGKLLQPGGIVESQKETENTIKAALDLELLKEKEYVSTNFNPDQKSRELILSALDSHVFNDQKLEPYFAPFYSYLLSKENTKGLKKNPKEWVDSYHDETGGRADNNPFNDVKLVALYRWYIYAGLGWRDLSEEFQAYPYERIKRRLAHIFKDNGKLMVKDFVENLGIACPELDGGKVFNKNKSQTMDNNNISLGVSQVLVTLHEEEVVTLFCPRDSDGPSIEKAKPRIKGEIQLPRLSMIELNP